MPARTQIPTPTHALGTFGLLLMLIVARLTGAAYEPAPSLTGRLRGMCARRVIDGVAAIGWMFDHLPSRSGSAGAGHRGIRPTHAHA